MTVNDFVKRLKPEDMDKMMIFSDGIGWSNIWFENKSNEIVIIPDKNNSPFSSDK